MSAEIAVVVVAHASGTLLIDCARRVLADPVVRELVVVDNASDDGSIEALQSALAGEARLRVRRNRDNPGFSVACNQGARDTTAPWLLFLNPDCLVEADTFAQSLAQADPARECLIGADVRGVDGGREPAARRNDPTPWRMVASALGLARWSGRWPALAGVSRPYSADGAASTDVDAVSGAFLLMPRTLFERLGGFDEGYRLHAEDLDLCRRARQAGARVLVAERARVLHAKGTSSRRAPLFVAWHKHRGLWRYFRRHEYPSRSWPVRAAVGAMIWTRFAALAPVLAAQQWWRARGA